ncbi:MAG: hydroxyacylglutathione hydrolase [Panacagrimonas sp.]
MELVAIPAFSDNYLWLLVRDGEAVVVDPGDAGPVEAQLTARGLRLSAILVTHHHPDHVGGLASLLARREVPVYGPEREAGTIGLLSVQLKDGGTVEVLGRTFEVMEVPGHTLGHIAYFSAAIGTSPPILLCGDTLFSAGCGRLFEGTPTQMHHSLGRLAALPADTQVCCAHEYTGSNLRFAQAVEPENSAVREHLLNVQDLRAAGLPSVPSTIGLELRINPFLRVREPEVRVAAERHSGQKLEDQAQVFAVLRAWKDTFRPAPAP